MTQNPPIRPDQSPAVPAEARLAAIIESSDDAILSKTLSGVVMSWNLAAERMLGYSSEEILGKSIYLVIPPELHFEEKEILARIAQGERVAHYETRRTHKDGRVIPVQLTVSPIRDSTGRIMGVSSIQRDISERNRSDAVQARLAALVESSDDAIVSKTPEGKVMSWNPAAEQMFGYSAAEMIGQSILKVVPAHLQDEERQILARVAQGEHVAHYETTRVRKDKREIMVSLTISPLRDPAGKIVGASAIKRDITEQKKAEEAYRQIAKMESIGRLAGGLAHDFNNQLHALVGLANFVARDPGLSPSAQQDLVEIQKTHDRMASLTRQLLAFARQQVLTPETLDLNGAVSETLPLLQRLIGSSVQMELKLAPGPKWVRVDRSQLVQVLMNLAINARDAMPRGGGLVLRTETAEVGPGHVHDRQNLPVETGAFAELSVTDTGEGIPPELIPRIFEPFFTTKEVGLGTGLGLATVEGIVSQSGGHIRVESAVGRGTTIVIMFPIAPDPGPETAGTSSSRTGQRPSGRVLVVDDEQLVREVVSRSLKAEGYEVTQAQNGKEALDLLDQVGGAFDLVISDVVMPVMCGQELGEEIGRLYPTLPIVWMSGHPREVSFADPAVIRDQPYLQKPVPLHLLLQTVEGALTRKAGAG